MAKKLIANTIVTHPQTGTPVLLAGGGDLPDWAEGLVGDHLLDKPSKSTGASTETSSSQNASVDQGGTQSLPPRSGPGSAAPQWRAYARGQGVEVADDASRDDVIDALEAAGKPTK